MRYTHIKPSAILIGLITVALGANSILAADTLYPPKENRQPSPGNTTYYIDPVKGDDQQSGVKENLAWRSFYRVNQLRLAPGDKVKIISPGSFDQTLMIMGSGTSTSPIEVSFAAGRYDIFTKNLYRQKFNISQHQWLSRVGQVNRNISEKLQTHHGDGQKGQNYLSWKND